MLAHDERVRERRLAQECARLAHWHHRQRERSAAGKRYADAARAYGLLAAHLDHRGRTGAGDARSSQWLAEIAAELAEMVGPGGEREMLEAFAAEMVREAHRKKGRVE